MLAVNIAAKLPSHLAIRVLVTALGTGVVTDQLLRATPWGLNLTLSVAAVVLAAAILTRWGNVQLEGEGRWLVVPLLFFASALAWRDSATLNVANALALVVGTRAGRRPRSGAGDSAAGGVWWAVRGGRPELRKAGQGRIRNRSSRRAGPPGIEHGVRVVDRRYAARDVVGAATAAAVARAAEPSGWPA